MARNGSGVYSVPTGTEGVANTAISSADYNAFLADLTADLNAARPVTAGGTGETSASLPDTWTLHDPVDSTKKVRFDAGSITTATTRVVTAPNADLNLAHLQTALKGYIYKLTLSNNTTDATNDIDIAAGSAASDSTTAVLMTLASGLTKRLDASWAVGTNQGGLDTGSIANTTYHVFLIMRSDTGVVDVLFSTSPTSPSMPTNYDYKRRIGSIVRSAGAILGFTQSGDQFLWNVSYSDWNATNPGTSTVNRALTVPTGIIVDALIVATVFDTGPLAATIGVLITSLSQTDTVASGTRHSLFALVSSGASDPYGDTASMAVRTDSSATIRTNVNASGANTVFRGQTVGFIDTRDRL